MAKLEIWISTVHQNKDWDNLYIETDSKKFPELATYLIITADEIYTGSTEYWTIENEDRIGFTISYEVLIRIMDNWPTLPLSSYVTYDPHRDLNLLKKHLIEQVT
jgi:hypothetical protein